MSGKRKHLAINIVFYFSAILFSIFFIYPLWQNIVGGFSTLQNILTGKISLIPHPIVWNWPALSAAQQNPTPWRSLLNTFLISFCAVPCIFFSALTAFGLTRFKGPGQNVVFLVVISSMMLPFTVTMIPKFIMFKSFGWINTYLPMYIPTIAGSAPAVFLMRQYMKSLPKEIDDAAKVDGAGYFRIFWQIIMPLSVPVLVTTFIFTFVAIWNDFMTPLIMLNSSKLFPISLAMMSLKAASDQITPWNLIMFEALLATVPLIIIYFIFQRYIIQGVVSSSIKG